MDQGAGRNDFDRRRKKLHYLWYATFCRRVGLKRSRGPARPNGTDDNRTFMSAKILVIDDSGLARRMLRQMLEEMGHSVEEAADGPTALERYYINRHDLVLLDMVMNGMYGLEVLAKIRELNPEVRVIVATADIQNSTREQVRDAGAAAFLNKPVNRKALGEVV